MAWYQVCQVAQEDFCLTHSRSAATNARAPSLPSLVGGFKLKPTSHPVSPPSSLTHISLQYYGAMKDKGIRCDGFWITRWTQDHPREDREAMIGGVMSATTLSELEYCAVRGMLLHVLCACVCVCCLLNR